MKASNRKSAALVVVSVAMIVVVMFAISEYLDSGSRVALVTAFAAAFVLLVSLRKHAK